MTSTPTKPSKKPKPADLVTQGIDDVKFRISRNDVLNLCLHEAKGKIENQFEAQRQVCIAMKVKVKHAMDEVEAELKKMMTKRYAKIIKALADEDIGREPYVSVYYTDRVDVQVHNYNKKVSEQEKRASYVGGYRMRKTNVRNVHLVVGDMSSHNSYDNERRSTVGFEVNLLARDIDDLPSLDRVGAALAELDRQCDKLDFIQRELDEFKRRSESAKTELMARILDSSDKGREILTLVKTLAVELDLKNPPIVIPATIDG